MSQVTKIVGLFNLAGRLFFRSMTSRTAGPSCCEVLFVLSPADIATPSSGGIFSLQLDGLLQAATGLGMTTGFITRPEDPLPSEKSKYEVFPFPVFPLPKIILRLLLISLKFVFKRKHGSVSKDDLRSCFFPSWSSVLARSNPRLVIGIGLPDELCETSRRKGVPSAEVQHGMFDSFPRHYWSSNPPDYFLAWDSVSAKKARASHIASTVIGHPLALPPQIDYKDGGATPLGCVALSWDWPGGALDKRGSISPALAEASKWLQDFGYKLILRPHPVLATLPNFQWKRYVRTIRRIIPGSEVFNPLEWSWPEMIARCDFLLTHDSSSAFEFGIASKPSVVLDETARTQIQLSLESHGFDGNLVGGGVNHVTPTVPQFQKSFGRRQVDLESTIKSLLINL